MIRHTLAKAEVQLEVIEPRNSRINVFVFEDLGQVLIMFFEQVRVGSVVEGDEDGVIAHPDIAVDSAEDGGSEVGSIPGGERMAEALAELVAGGLGDEGHRHLPEANIEVEGAGAFPAESLLGIEEFLDMPALGVVDGQVDDLVAIAGSEEGLRVERFGNFLRSVGPVGSR
jgi:hypothetical protein